MQKTIIGAPAGFKARLDHYHEPAVGGPGWGGPALIYWSLTCTCGYEAEGSALLGESRGVPGECPRCEAEAEGWDEFYGAVLDAREVF